MIYGWRPDADSKLPLYIQLANYYKQLVEKGIITEGYKLPGRNKLIDQLGISKTTVSLALERLVSEGVLTSKAKSGYFVAEQTGQGPDWNSYINKAKYQQWPDGQLASTLLEIRTKEIGIGQNLDVSRYLREASINIKAEDCSKFGLSSLRQNLAEYLKRYGINTNAENILITPQIMESMHLLYDAFVGHWTTFVHRKNSVINSLYIPGAIGVGTA